MPCREQLASFRAACGCYRGLQNRGVSTLPYIRDTRASTVRSGGDAIYICNDGLGIRESRGREREVIHSQVRSHLCIAS